MLHGDRTCDLFNTWTLLPVLISQIVKYDMFRKHDEIWPCQRWLWRDFKADKYLRALLSPGWCTAVVAWWILTKENEKCDVEWGREQTQNNTAFHHMWFGLGFLSGTLARSAMITLSSLPFPFLFFISSCLSVSVLYLTPCWSFLLREPWQWPYLYSRWVSSDVKT